VKQTDLLQEYLGVNAPPNMKVKRDIPDTFWLSENYLPNLDEATRFPVKILNKNSVVELSMKKIDTGVAAILIYDIEVYQNYFLCAFYSPDLDGYFYFETLTTLNHTGMLAWVFEKFTCVGFNNINYDTPIASLAIAGLPTAEIKVASDTLIKGDPATQKKVRPYQLLRRSKVNSVAGDQIDLIQPATGRASLKIYGGRVHTRLMQSLPVHHDSVLTVDQIRIVRWYCVNDLRCTYDLYKKLKPALDLRADMSKKYSTDLRSKSDAQIAETVLRNKLEHVLGYRLQRPEIQVGAELRFVTPDYMKFESPTLQSVLEIVQNSIFRIAYSGKLVEPRSFANLKKFTINKTDYAMGVGGLHSIEKSVSHFADDEYFISDRDVASYYPAIMLNQGLKPDHLPEEFLTEFRDIVNTRLKAKASGDKTTADSLKIVINSTYGKFSDPYSIFYDPKMTLQVTLSGQLSLLMLVERCELAGIEVVSANTDGVVIRSTHDRYDDFNAIIKQWEIDTAFDTEETRYAALLSRDVNNYIAVKHPDDYDDDAPLSKRVKLKGAFATGAINRNPQYEICTTAVLEFVLNKKPIITTLLECRDLRKFLTVRKVAGGAVRVYDNHEPPTYHGNAIRWYYGENQSGEIIYATNGNRVGSSAGAVMANDLNMPFPDDIDYDKYEKITIAMLKNLGVTL